MNAMSKRGVAVVALLIGLLLGNLTGFFAGVSSSKFGQDFVEGVFSEERAADVANPQDLKRTGFSLQMPANWKVDTKMDDYDPESYFSIDSPGKNSVTFLIYDMETEPKENVDEQVKSYTLEYMKKATRTPFKKWGRYNGYGIELKGRVMGIDSGRIRIFSYSNEKKSFVVTELYSEDDIANTQPGFQKIESTFKLN